MTRININLVLMVVGLLFLIFAFFVDQEANIYFEMEDFSLKIGKAWFARTLGIVTVLNGLVYSMFYST